MDRDSKKRPKELEAEQEKLYGRIEEIKTETAKIQASDVVNYVGKLLCIIDHQKTWYREGYVLVKSQDEPDSNGVIKISGPSVLITREDTGKIIHAVMGGEMWLDNKMRIKEVTKDEVIKITSQLGLDYWNDKL